MKRVDLTGKTFGDWTVLKYLGDKKYLCRCNCSLHTERTVSTYSLTSGKSTGCGHANKLPSENLIGKQYGDITVISYAGLGEWVCKCKNGHISQHRARVFVNKPDYKCKECEKIEKERKRQKDAIQDTDDKPKKSMVNFKDNTNKYFGDLKAVEYLGSSYWKCECICGLTKEVRAYSLNSGAYDNYKCKHVRMVNQRFGRLVVLERHGNKCTCRCDCGNIITTETNSIITGSKLSCNCLRNSNLYSKQEVISAIDTYKKSNNGETPYYNELAEQLGISTGTLCKYLKEYGLKNEIKTIYSSHYEKELAELAYSIVGKDNVELHNRTAIQPLELDIYIPILNLAIEVNGNYWHSTYRKDKNYHKNKSIQCAKNGIQLIHVFEYELQGYRREKTLRFLKDRLSSNKIVYNARSLNIKECKSIETKGFIDENHLQGYVPAEVSLTLQSENNEILAVMSFGKPRFNSKYQYELIRLCFKNGVVINGGAERLLNHFIKNYEPKSIVSYCNIGKFTGSIYNRLGFRAVELTSPNYVWVNQSDSSVLSRYQVQRYIKNLADSIDFDIIDTEDTIMYEMGYLKIYDSGNAKYEYINYKVG